MVKTLEYAAKKWERKTSAVGPKWKAASEEATGRACMNMAAFLGKSPLEIAGWCEAQKAGIEGVSPEDFQKAIRAKRSKWLEGMKRIT